MKKLLFATNNQSKSKRFSEGLLKKGIEIVTLNDLGIELQVSEDGTNAIENALIKAKSAYEKVNIPVIGMDDTLYLENVPEEKQTGLYVRRVNGKTLNDDEMLKHYMKMVKMYGNDGKLNCKWIYGLAVINEKGKESTYTWNKDNFYMVDKKSDTINSGYPLNSISKYKAVDKYFSELTLEDKEAMKENEDHVIDFIERNIMI